MAEPFLRWVGGKGGILSTILTHIPSDYISYYEPFLGGGSVFFGLNPKRAFLSDINQELVITFQEVRDHVEPIIEALSDFQEWHSQPSVWKGENYPVNVPFYYDVREAFNAMSRETDRTALAASFIYLNKTSYNGVWRTNQDGGYNVPCNMNGKPTILAEQRLREVNTALRQVEIEHCGFEDIEIRKRGLYYLDPPYDDDEKTEQGSFTGYTKNGFDKFDHIRLQKFCSDLDKAGAYFILSNSDTEFIRRAFRDFTIIPIMAPRFVAAKSASRGDVQELLIKNF